MTTKLPVTASLLQKSDTVSWYTGEVIDEGEGSTRKAITAYSQEEKLDDVICQEKLEDMKKASSEIIYQEEGKDTRYYRAYAVQDELGEFYNPPYDAPWAKPLEVVDAECEEKNIPNPMKKTFFAVKTVLGLKDESIGSAVSPWDMVQDDLPDIIIVDTNFDGKSDTFGYDFNVQGWGGVTYGTYESDFSDADLDGKVDSVTSTICHTDALTVQVDMDDYSKWADETGQTNYCRSMEYSSFWDFATINLAFIASSAVRIVPGIGWLLGAAIDCGAAIYQVTTDASWPGH